MNMQGIILNKKIFLDALEVFVSSAKPQTLQESQVEILQAIQKWLVQASRR